MDMGAPSIHLGIILNPLARRAAHPDLPKRLQERCAAAAQAARISVCTSLAVTRGQAELAAALESFAQKRIDVLAVCGGDGTLMATVSAAVAAYGEALPPILILPGGTMNTAARNLGMYRYGGPEAVLFRLLFALGAAGKKGLAGVPRCTQEVVRIKTLEERPLILGRSDVVSNEDGDGVSRTRYGFIFGAAMGARYLSAYARRPGLLWAAWLGLRTLGSSLLPGGGSFARWLFERTPAELTVDGERATETAFRLLLVSTVPDVGLGMRVPWQAGRVRGRFHLIASSLPLIANARQVVRMQRGQPLKGSPHLDLLAQSASLRFATSQPLTVDGDLFTARGVDLSLGPSLEVLLP